jgi:hypothetical protein
VLPRTPFIGTGIGVVGDIVAVVVGTALQVGTPKDVRTGILGIGHAITVRIPGRGAAIGGRPARFGGAGILAV